MNLIRQIKKTKKKKFINEFSIIFIASQSSVRDYYRKTAATLSCRIKIRDRGINKNAVVFTFIISPHTLRMWSGAGVVKTRRSNRKSYTRSDLRIAARFNLSRAQPQLPLPAACILFVYCMKRSAGDAIHLETRSFSSSFFFSVFLSFFVVVPFSPPSPPFIFQWLLCSRLSATGVIKLYFFLRFIIMLGSTEKQYRFAWYLIWTTSSESRLPTVYGSPGRYRVWSIFLNKPFVFLSDQVIEREREAQNFIQIIVLRQFRL